MSSSPTHRHSTFEEAWNPPQGRRWRLEDGRAMLAAMAASGLGVTAFARSLTPQRVIFWRERCRSADAVVGVRQQVRPLRLAEEAAPHPALDPVVPLSGVTVSVGAIHFIITRASDPAAVLLLLRSIQACEVREPC